MYSPQTSLRLMAVAILLLCLAGSTGAQTFMMTPVPEESPTVGVRFMRGNIDYLQDVSVVSGTYDLYVNYPVARRVSLLASIPYSYVDGSYRYSFFGSPDGSFSESAIGNVFVGAQMWRRHADYSRHVVTLGIFLPTAGESNSRAVSIGALSNYYDLFRVAPKVATIRTNFAYYTRFGAQSKLRLSAEIGPDIAMPTEGGDVEIFTHYGTSLQALAGKLMLRFELLGSFIATEDADFTDRFDHYFAVGASLNGSRFRPQLFYQLPLDDQLSDAVSGVWGFKLEYSLPQRLHSSGEW